MENKLFGFLIDNEIQLDIENRRLTRFSASQNRGFTVGYVELNEAMLRLLVYMLKHHHEEMIHRDVLLKKVWDDNQLISSNQRLWQTIKDLRLKFLYIGLPKEFIINVRGVGYSLNSHNISPLVYG